jgi:hypothetical protein
VLRRTLQENPSRGIQGADRQAAQKPALVVGNRSVNVYALVSPAIQDQQIQDQRVWQAIQFHLQRFTYAIPNVHIQHGDARSLQDAHQQRKAIDNADLILIALSEDFLASLECMADVKRVLWRAKTYDVKVQALLLRPCTWQKTSLAYVPLVFSDVIMHLSRYAQEQRILQAAANIRALLASMALKGKQDGAMSLLQWLLWQFYRNSRNNCPYFVVQPYVLKYVRPAGNAAALFHLLHLHTGHVIADYSIGLNSNKRLTELLRIIAPGCTVPSDVQGMARREIPL